MACLPTCMKISYNETTVYDQVLEVCMLPIASTRAECHDTCSSHLVASRQPVCFQPGLRLDSFEECEVLCDQGGLSHIPIDPIYGHYFHCYLPYKMDVGRKGLGIWKGEDHVHVWNKINTKLLQDMDAQTFTALRAWLSTIELSCKCVGCHVPLAVDANQLLCRMCKAAHIYIHEPNQQAFGQHSGYLWHVYYQFLMNYGSSAVFNSWDIMGNEILIKQCGWFRLQGLVRRIR